MAKHRKVFKRLKTIQIFAVIIGILLILMAGIFLYHHFVKANNYLIENKYYGFKLQTPSRWVGEEKTFYSDDNIAQLLLGCNNDKSSSASDYEIGAFRFENQKFPDLTDTFAAGAKSGAVLEISVNCVPGTATKVVGYGSNLKIGGEKIFELNLNLPGFGDTKQLSFLHNNFEYKLKECIYISPVDKNAEKKLRAKYMQAFNKIISSFKFIK